jgi:hypothetical protein
LYTLEALGMIVIAIGPELEYLIEAEADDDDGAAVEEISMLALELGDETALGTEAAESAEFAETTPLTGPQVPVNEPSSEETLVTSASGPGAG